MILRTLLASASMLLMAATITPNASAHLCWEHACGDCNSGIFHLHYDTLNDPLQPYCAAVLPAIDQGDPASKDVSQVELITLTEYCSAQSP